MSKLPVIHKTKLTKDQTYFINTEGLTNLLSHCKHKNNLSLNFSDDPSLYKSNYDRYIKKERKIVVMSCRYKPELEEINKSSDDRLIDTNYTITVYAVLKTIREELIAQFEKEHFATLLNWLNEERDRVWQDSAHAILFLLNIDSEEIEVDYDIDFDSYNRHNKKQKFRTTIRNH